MGRLCAQVKKELLAALAHLGVDLTPASQPLQVASDTCVRSGVMHRARSTPAQDESSSLDLFLLLLLLLLDFRQYGSITLHWPFFVLILSWFCPGFVVFLCFFCPCFVLILSLLCPFSVLLCPRGDTCTHPSLQPAERARTREEAERDWKMRVTVSGYYERCLAGIGDSDGSTTCQ
jgi:hypothetical protein